MRLAFVVTILVAASACGSEIGDECIVSSDCSPNGDRQCDISSKQGYCTIQGCDINTCPEEAVCVRFFTGNFSNIACDPLTENISTDNCSFDELCSLVGRCVPRSSEVRYCMRTCDSSSDCRDGYECRDLTLMAEHGGEPVTGGPVDSSSPKFCAPSLN
ncbi:MAG TPA: hypothetical protein VFQ53_09105 [Kofleriaceae bacterium]|nr:hypothetical protein [Kofleriaceae bacterium]